MFEYFLQSGWCFHRILSAKNITKFIHHLKGSGGDSDKERLAEKVVFKCVSDFSFVAEHFSDTSKKKTGHIYKKVKSD